MLAGTLEFQRFWTKPRNVGLGGWVGWKCKGPPELHTPMGPHRGIAIPLNFHHLLGR